MRKAICCYYIPVSKCCMSFLMVNKCVFLVSWFVFYKSLNRKVTSLLHLGFSIKHTRAWRCVSAAADGVESLTDGKLWMQSLLKRNQVFPAQSHTIFFPPRAQTAHDLFSYDVQEGCVFPSWHLKFGYQRDTANKEKSKAECYILNILLNRRQHMFMTHH